MQHVVGTANLSVRSCELLKETIQAYIETGHPVGSRFLSKRSKSRLSAATIRNIMFDLEEAGFLHQPHNSAGRLPTDKGYRFYVDSLMEKRRLSASEKEHIQASMEKESNDGFTRLMEGTSRLLANLANNVGIVIAPTISKAILQHIHFLKLGDHRILAIIIGKTGIVQNKLVRIEEEISQDELERASQFLTCEFAGKTLPVIQTELERMLHEDRSFYSPWWTKLSILCARCFQEDCPQGIYLDGAAKIMSHPEFCDMSRVRALFETFEHRSELVRILSECIKDESSGVRILIGKETGLSGMPNCALITSPYIYDNRVAGSLGILGPSRIEYGKTVSLVDYVARLFSSILSHS